MKKTSTREFYLLNQKGRLLREILLHINDDDLKLMVPSPSHGAIIRLKRNARWISEAYLSIN